jgi:peptidyl-prolyl cis-trans isomerase SurA
MMYNELLLNQAKLDSVDIPDQQVDAEMENRLRVLSSKWVAAKNWSNFTEKRLLR